MHKLSFKQFKVLCTIHCSVLTFWHGSCFSLNVPNTSLSTSLRLIFCSVRAFWNNDVKDWSIHIKLSIKPFHGKLLIIWRILTLTQSLYTMNSGLHISSLVSPLRNFSLNQTWKQASYFAFKSLQSFPMLFIFQFGSMYSQRLIYILKIHEVWLYLLNIYKNSAITVRITT